MSVDYNDCVDCLFFLWGSKNVWWAVSPFLNKSFVTLVRYPLLDKVNSYGSIMDSVLPYYIYVLSIWPVAYNTGTHVLISQCNPCTYVNNTFRLLFFCSIIDGPSVSPSIFVSIIQSILEDHTSNLMIYLDDIIIRICCSMVKKHNSKFRLRQVLDRRNINLNQRIGP